MQLAPPGTNVPLSGCAGVTAGSAAMMFKVSKQVALYVYVAGVLHAVEGMLLETDKPTGTFGMAVPIIVPFPAFTTSSCSCATALRTAMFKPARFCWRLNSGCCLEKRASPAPLITRNTAVAIISSSSVKPCPSTVRLVFFISFFTGAPCWSESSPEDPCSRSTESPAR